MDLFRPFKNFELKLPVNDLYGTYLTLKRLKALFLVIKWTKINIFLLENFTNLKISPEEPLEELKLAQNWVLQHVLLQKTS